MRHMLPELCPSHCQLLTDFENVFLLSHFVNNLQQSGYLVFHYTKLWWHVF